MAKTTLRHDYTNELELKSLLIRIKNKREDKGTEQNNTKINKYLKWHTLIKDKKYDNPTKRNIVKKKIKDKVVILSEGTCSDQLSYERFGEIILLMISKILTKPQFSGYTFKDEFYSDAVYKIIKYLHNFNHKLISERSGQPVNAFAYMSQYIHNSILHIINTKKKEAERHRNKVLMERLDHNYKIIDSNYILCSRYKPVPEKEVVETIHLPKINGNLINELIELQDEIDSVTALILYYPKDYRITFDEYEELKPYLKGKVSIIRSTE